MHGTHVAYQMILQVETTTARLTFMDSSGLIMYVLEVYCPFVVRIEPLWTHRTSPRTQFHMNPSDMQSPLVRGAKYFAAAIAREVASLVNF